MTTSLRWAFQQTQEYGRTALIGHLPAGLPTVAGSVRALQVLSQHVDVLEVGLDDASRITVAEAVETVRAAGVSVPVLLRSRWDPIRIHDPRALAAALAAAGAAGLVLPDLHPHSRGAGAWLGAAAPHRLSTVFSASDGQVFAAVAASTGFVRLPVAPEGGPSQSLDLEASRAHAWMLASLSREPICTGGYLRPDQAAEIAPAVDAIEISVPFIRAVELAPADPHFSLLEQCAFDYATAIRARASGRDERAA